MWGERNDDFCFHYFRLATKTRQYGNSNWNSIAHAPAPESESRRLFDSFELNKLSWKRVCAMCNAETACGLFGFDFISTCTDLESGWVCVTQNSLFFIIIMKIYWRLMAIDGTRRLIQRNKPIFYILTRLATVEWRKKERKKWCKVLIKCALNEIVKSHRELWFVSCLLLRNKCVALVRLLVRTFSQIFRYMLWGQQTDKSKLCVRRSTNAMSIDKR